MGRLPVEMGGRLPVEIEGRWPLPVENEGWRKLPMLPLRPVEIEGLVEGRSTDPDGRLNDGLDDGMLPDDR